jgi:SAM-dependent methyltransferase
MAQYDDLARWYDPLYAAAGKDPAAEARALLDVAQRLGVRPASLLDVACGTGKHLVTFHEMIGDVVGIDNAPAMLDIARDRLSDEVTLRHGDMRRFDLGRTFDVVTCLFSAIGHVRDEDDLEAAIGAMAAHVAPGGALLVEPWLTPDRIVEDGRRSLDTVTTDDGVCARAIRSEVRGDVLVLQFAWAVATREGIRTADESFRMPLFDRERYLAAVERTGLEPSWLEVPALWADRGLLVGRRPPE